MSTTITVLRTEISRHHSLGQRLSEMSIVMKETDDSFVYCVKPGMLFSFLTSLNAVGVGYTTQFDTPLQPSSVAGKQTKTVLYIDNDPDDLELFSEAIKVVDPAIRCVVAASGSHALELLRNQESLPDYLFLDINMPRMDGKETLERIRRIKQYDCVAIVLFSTGLRPDDAQDYTALGANHFMTKAYSFKDLCEQLRRFLKR